LLRLLSAVLPPRASGAAAPLLPAVASVALLACAFPPLAAAAPALSSPLERASPLQSSQGTRAAFQDWGRIHAFF
jgi:hypothetical protein